MNHLQALISRTIVHIVLEFLLFYSFLSNYCNRDHFLHYKTRANVYMVLGRGVVGSCFGVQYCLYLGGFTREGFSLQHGHHSNPTTPKLQHTSNQEQYDQGGNSTE
jgi:hypothetical protein